MPYEPLHHKYRPQTFGDLVGQETIAATLSNALKQARIAPAYLFTGPRGTGKTSSARILAKSLNCLASDRPTRDPCGKCEACLAIARGSALDVMEIDAASNTGVDNIREIIERSKFAPVQCRYKIYAIDECHMLSTAAFNALLKTLEEPPPQVVFILATTDPQRVLSTIISRCQRFDYRRIPLEEMSAHLKYIADAEQIAIADDALTLIAQIANGGLRDAESLLDQLSLLPETISVAKVWDLVGAVPEQDLLKLLEGISRNDSVAVLEQCRSLLDRGREPLVVLQNLASFYLNLLIAKTAPQRLDLTTITETGWQQLCDEAKNWDTSSILRGQQHLKAAETQLKQTTQPRLWLEVTLLGLLPEYTAIAHQKTAISNPTTIQSTANRAVSTTVVPAQNTTPANSAQEAVTKSSIVQPSNNQSRPTPHYAKPEIVPDTPATVAKATATQSRAKSGSQKIVESVAPNREQNSVDNQEIWSKVVSCLHPPTTQALLKQQCHLVSFDGVSAIVGISSVKLQKLNQGKVPNIEAAFAQVCQRKVKVQLEVANAQESLAKTAATAKPVATAPPSAPISKSIPPQIAPPPEQVAPSSNHTLVSPSQSNRVNKSSTAIAPEHHQPSEITPSPVGGVISYSPIPEPVTLDGDQDYEDDKLQQAIDNLTQSFEGEVVHLDNVKEESLEVSSLSNIKIERPDLEEYEDEW